MKNNSFDNFLALILFCFILGCIVIFFLYCAYPIANVKFTDEIVCIDRDGKHFVKIKEIDFLTLDAVDFIEQKNDTIFIELNSGNNYFLAHSKWLEALDDTTRFTKSLK